MRKNTPSTGRSTWTATFSATHMKVTYVDNQGAAKEELFELHRTQPEGLFVLREGVDAVQVTAKNGRVFSLGMIPGKGDDKPRFVAWPA